MPTGLRVIIKCRNCELIGRNHSVFRNFTDNAAASPVFMLCVDLSEASVAFVWLHRFAGATERLKIVLVVASAGTARNNVVHFKRLLTRWNPTMSAPELCWSEIFVFWADRGIYC